MDNIYIFDLDDTLVIHKNNKVNYKKMKEDKNLNELLNKLGKDNKFIFTNGTYSHAELCLEKTGLKNYFKKTFARDTVPMMKPFLRTYKFVQEQIYYENNDNVGKKIIFFDDNIHNIQSAKSYGWKTVWIHPQFMKKSIYADYSFPNIYHALLYFSFIDKF